MPYKYGTGTVLSAGGDCGRHAASYLRSSNWEAFTKELRQTTDGQTIVCSMQYPLKAFIAKLPKLQQQAQQFMRDEVDNMIKAGWILGALCPGNHTGPFRGQITNPYYMAIMILILKPTIKRDLDALEEEYEKTVIPQPQEVVTTMVKSERRKRYILNGRVRYLTDVQFAAYQMGDENA